MKIYLVYLKPFRLFNSVVLLFVYCSLSYAQNTTPYSYTGAAETFIVPPCVLKVHVKAWGAGGAGGGVDAYGGGPGGAGSYAEAVITVAAGDVLTIYVGGNGIRGYNGAGTPGGAGGWGYGNGGNGGNAGPSCCSGSGGGAGGSSGVLRNGTPVIIASGGGGGGGGGCKSVGGNGGAGGINGSASTCSSGGVTAGNSSASGAAGQSHPADGGGGGGGGGGAFNGGQGGFAPPVGSSCNPATDCGAGGGGGGDSWAVGTGITLTNGSGQTPGNSADSDLPAGDAAGGANSVNGTNGFLLLDYNADGAPNVGFGSTSVCYGNATQFTDNTINLTGTITSWQWNFGDGSALNSTQNPAYLYASAGTYNTTLIVNNSFGCADTLTKVVNVFYNPIANFTHSYACAGYPMYFSNLSTVNSATSIASYLWVFGDGSASSTLQDPVHNYPPGTFNINLTTTTVDGCSDVINFPVNVYDAPTSSFTFSNTCLIDSAHFNNTTTNPTLGTIASWHWDFGDGSPSNTSVWSPSHIYTFAGNYVVTLITYSSNGCPDTTMSTITVFSMPHANFEIADICLHQAINLTDLSTVSGGSITGWSWNFGDGSALNTSQNPGYTYTNSGTYTVTLIATSNNGCKDTISKTMVVHPLPHPHFSTKNICLGSFAQFNDSSTILSPDLISLWSWRFGDGSTVNNQNTSHLYASTGLYHAQLVAVSSFGCKDSISKIITVNPNPIVNFTANDTVGCEPLCIHFKDSSIVATGINTHWLWNFGDGSALSSNQNPEHCYTNNNVFDPLVLPVSLTVTSDSGCVIKLTKNNYITVYPMPVANFEVDPKTASIINPIISFIDLSIGAHFWNWHFGDTTTSFISHPLPHTYADTGSYLITLIVSTQYGCIDTAYQTITIEPDFVFYVPNAFTPDGDGVNDNFTGKGIFIKEFEMMIFDRWGNLIFFSNSIDIPWDGKANHGTEMAQRDVYVYSIQVTDLKNRKHNYRGIVTLVR